MISGIFGGIFKCSLDLRSVIATQKGLRKWSLFWYLLLSKFDSFLSFLDFFQNGRMFLQVSKKSCCWATTALDEGSTVVASSSSFFLCVNPPDNTSFFLHSPRLSSDRTRSSEFRHWGVRLGNMTGQFWLWTVALVAQESGTGRSRRRWHFTKPQN